MPLEEIVVTAAASEGKRPGRADRYFLRHRPRDLERAGVRQAGEYNEPRTQPHPCLAVRNGGTTDVRAARRHNQRLSARTRAARSRCMSTMCTRA